MIQIGLQVLALHGAVESTELDLTIPAVAVAADSAQLRMLSAAIGSVALQPLPAQELSRQAELRRRRRRAKRPDTERTASAAAVDCVARAWRASQSVRWDSLALQRLHGQMESALRTVALQSTATASTSGVSGDRISGSGYSGWSSSRAKEEAALDTIKCWALDMVEQTEALQRQAVDTSDWLEYVIK
jgi:hypothetical protein